MFTIICKNTKTGTEERYEFANAKLAHIFKDYHLNFGHWSGQARWLKASEVLPENMRFVIDEMTKVENGEIVRYYHITDGLLIESYVGESKDTFLHLRAKRCKVLEATDWTQMADVPVSQEDRKLYRGYRQYLRDLPSLHNSESVLSAEVYTFEEWKLGKR